MTEQEKAIEREEYQNWLATAINPEEYRRIRDLPDFDKRVWSWCPYDDMYFNNEVSMRRKGEI